MTNLAVWSLSATVCIGILINYCFGRQALIIHSLTAIGAIIYL